MTEQMDTAPVTTTETAPAQNTQQPPITPPTQQAEVKASLLDVFRSKAPQGAPTGWLEKVKDEDALIKTVYAAQSLIGKKGDIPAEDAPDEVRGEFWKKMGSDSIAPIALTEEQKSVFGDSIAKMSEIYKSTLSTAKNSKDHAEKMMAAFVQAEETQMKADQKAEQEAEKAELQALSSKFGLTPDQIAAELKGVYSRFGWSETTPIREALLTIAKETGNSRVMQDANLNNTLHGIEQQTADAHKILLGMASKGTGGIEYDMQLQKVKELTAKLTTFQKNNG